MATLRRTRFEHGRFPGDLGRPRRTLARGIDGRIPRSECVRTASRPHPREPRKCEVSAAGRRFWLVEEHCRQADRSRVTRPGQCSPLKRWQGWRNHDGRVARAATVQRRVVLGIRPAGLVLGVAETRESLEPEPGKGRAQEYQAADSASSHHEGPPSRCARLVARSGIPDEPYGSQLGGRLSTTSASCPGWGPLCFPKPTRAGSGGVRTEPLLFIPRQAQAVR